MNTIPEERTIPVVDWFRIGAWIPPAIKPYLKRLLGRTDLSGNFETFQDLVAVLGLSYDTAWRFEGVRRESWPLLAAIYTAGPRVLDFGGGAGVMYHELRPFLPEVEWRVVDPTSRTMEDAPPLTFRETIEGFSPDIVILGGVVQYLEHPYETVRELASLGAKRMAFNRVPVGKERIMVHRKAFPFRILNEEKLLESCAGYRVDYQVDTGHAEGPLFGFRYMTYLLQRSPAVEPHV